MSANSRAVSSTTRSPTDASARPQIERQASCWEHGGLGRGGVTEAQPNPRHQLLEAERLGHVVVGSPLETGDRVPHVVTGGEDHDGHLLAPGAHRRQHLLAIHARQAEVEDEQVEAVVAGEGQGVETGPHGHVVYPPARRPFSRNDTMRSSSSAMRILVMIVLPRRRRQRRSSSGILIVNVAPSPGRLTNETAPPWARAMASTIDSPMPVPSGRLRGGRPAGVAVEERAHHRPIDPRPRVAHPEQGVARRWQRRRGRSRRPRRCAAQRSWPGSPRPARADPGRRAWPRSRPVGRHRAPIGAGPAPSPG